MNYADAENENFDYCNLIADDQDSFFKSSNSEVNQLYHILRSHKIFTTIVESPFQEIFLVTEFKSGLYAVPLKWLILRSEYYIFSKFWESLPEVSDSNRKDIHLTFNNFLVCMLHFGFKKIYLTLDANYRNLFFSNCCWEIDNKTGEIKEKNFFGAKFSNSAAAENTIKNYENYTALFEKYKNFREEMIVTLPVDFFRRIDQ